MPMSPLAGRPWLLPLISVASGAVAAAIAVVGGATAVASIAAAVVTRASLALGASLELGRTWSRSFSARVSRAFALLSFILNLI